MTSNGASNPPPRKARKPAAYQAPSRHAIHSTRRGFTGKNDVEHDAMLEDIASDPKKVADLALTLQISEILEKHYPAHPWQVAVSHAQGCAFIKFPILMKADQQYVLHLAAINTANALERLVKKAGGELLEMHQMPRAGFSLTPFLEARSRRDAKRKKLLTPDPKKIISKLGGQKPHLVVPEFASSARPREAVSA